MGLQVHDWATAEKSPRVGMQGQQFGVIMSNEGDFSRAASPLCKVLIRMAPGKVSNVHVHERTHVYVDLVECGTEGVLTLAGDALEQEIWTGARQTLWIPPGIPHVAVYPRQADGVQPDVYAVETRTDPSATADVVPLDCWGMLKARLAELDLLGRVDFPFGPTS